MKVLNLRLITHKALPNMDLARAIIRIDGGLEAEIYKLAEQSSSTSGERHVVDQEIVFENWFGLSPPRPVTEVAMFIAPETVRWQGVYQDLTLGGFHQISVETEPLELDSLRRMPDEQDAPKVDACFISIWKEGDIRVDARLNPANGLVYLLEELQVPQAYQVRDDNVIEVDGFARMSVSKAPSNDDREYVICPEEMVVHEDLLKRLACQGA